MDPTPRGGPRLESARSSGPLPLWNGRSGTTQRRTGPIADWVRGTAGAIGRGSGLESPSSLAASKDRGWAAQWMALGAALVALSEAAGDAPGVASPPEATSGEAEPTPPAPVDRPAPRPTPAALTRREWEVAGLLALGLSNRDIARQLVLSERTAETHVEHLRNKLRVRSRAAVAAWEAMHDAGGWAGRERATAAGAIAVARNGVDHTRSAAVGGTEPGWRSAGSSRNGPSTLDDSLRRWSILARPCRAPTTRSSCCWCSRRCWFWSC